jgi:hypothetical protein
MGILHLPFNLYLEKLQEKKFQNEAYICIRAMPLSSIFGFEQII